MKIWGFRDLKTNTVRVTSRDPGAVLDDVGLAKTSASVPGGLGMRALVTNLQPILQTLESGTGLETYAEIDIGELSDEQLTDLMTPPPAPDPDPELEDVIQVPTPDAEDAK